MFLFSNFIYGTPPPISYERDVTNRCEELLRPYKRHNDQQREKMRKILVRDRLKWKAKLFKALQRALKDIWGCTYCDSGNGFRWIPNNRQSKAAPRNPSNDENRITDDKFENELEFHY